MGPGVQWVQSYVADDMIYCVHIAPDEAVVLDHARRGGFPAGFRGPRDVRSRSAGTNPALC
jgi:hypothetical protein